MDIEESLQYMLQWMVQYKVLNDFYMNDLNITQVQKVDKQYLKHIMPQFEHMSHQHM
jgi:hypothetical protein